MRSLSPKENPQETCVSHGYVDEPAVARPDTNLYANVVSFFLPYSALSIPFFKLTLNEKHTSVKCASVIFERDGLEKRFVIVLFRIDMAQFVTGKSLFFRRRVPTQIIDIERCDLTPSIESTSEKFHF